MTAFAYDARTVHARYVPYRRRFSQRLFLLLLDIDRLAEDLRSVPLLRLNRPGLFSFYERDHGAQGATSLRAWVEGLLQQTVDPFRPSRIAMLCMPRLLGFAFNPITIFYVYREERLAAIVYEVRNTFGERHAYVACLNSADDAADHRAVKAMHVSPFWAVEGEYRFRISLPEDTCFLRIENHVGEDCIHRAWLTGRRRALTNTSLAAGAFATLFLSFAAVAGIHWQALWIWLRGARYHKKPSPPSTSSTQASSHDALANS